jgi:hypothetical protein
MVTCERGKGWHTGPEYTNVAVAVVLEGHVASEVVAISSGAADDPEATDTEPEAANENALNGWMATDTVAASLPLLFIGSEYPLPVSAG